MHPRQGHKTRGCPGKGRPFPFGWKYTRGEALPNEGRADESSSDLGLFSAQLGRTAAWLPALPGTRHLPAGRGSGAGGGGAPRGSRRTGESGDLQWEGTRERGAPSFTLCAEERALIHSFPPRKIKITAATLQNSRYSVFVVLIACQSTVPGNQGGTRGMSSPPPYKPSPSSLPVPEPCRLWPGTSPK